ncbi:MAG: VanW family protein [Bacillota bacterium]
MEISQSGEDFRKKRFILWGKIPLPWLYAAGILILLGMALIFSARVYLPDDRILAGVEVEHINIGGMTRAAAEKHLRFYKRSVADEPVFLHWTKRTWVFLPGYSGLDADIRGTVEKAWRLGRRGFFWYRWYERLKIRARGANIKCLVREDRESLETYIQMLTEEIDHAPVSAQIMGVDKQGTPVISAELNGYHLKVKEFQALLRRAIYKMPPRHITLPVKVEKPRLTAAEIKEFDFKLLGAFTTKFDSTVTDRVHNIRLAAQAIHGAVLRAGEVFSYDAALGPRDMVRGFQEAPVLVKGELVPGLGGGICQVSSTVYNAALYARMEIVERRSHSRLSAYVPPGQDATVLEKSIDLKIKNNLPGPVLINCTVRGNKLRAEFWGQDTHPGETVELLSVVDKVTPFKVVEKPDPALAPGERVVEKKGEDGYDVTLYRIIKKDGKEIRREVINKSKYISMPEEVKVGPPADYPVLPTATVNQVR